MTTETILQVYLPTPLLRALKIQAVSEGVSMKSLLARILTKELKVDPNDVTVAELRRGRPAQPLEDRIRRVLREHQGYTTTREVLRRLNISFDQLKEAAERAGLTIYMLEDDSHRMVRDDKIVKEFFGG